MGMRDNDMMSRNMMRDRNMMMDNNMMSRNMMRDNDMMSRNMYSNRMGDNMGAMVMDRDMMATQNMELMGQDISSNMMLSSYKNGDKPDWRSQQYEPEDGDPALPGTLQQVFLSEWDWQNFSISTLKIHSFCRCRT